MVFKSPYGPLKDMFQGNIAEFMYQSTRLAETPDKKVLIDGKTGTSLTSSQVLELIGKIHTVMAETYQIGYDDVVCLFAPNTIYTPSINHGILSTGGIVSPANIAYNSEELKYQLDTSQAKLIVTVDKLLPTAKQAASTTKVVMLDDLLKQAFGTTKLGKPVHIADPAEKDAFYCFSSGTSGVPKCVMTSHLNMTSNCQQAVQAGPEFYNPDKIFGGFLPMTHIYGLSKFVFTLLYRAATTVVFERFELEPVLQAIVKYKINTLHVVPPVVVLFAKSPVIDQYPEVKQNLKNLMSGAAPLSKSLIDQVVARLGVNVFQGYGLTESSPVSHFFTHDPAKYRSDSIGWLMPSQDARIVDVVSGEDVTATNKAGELWMKGPNIMRGYLNNPKATNETLEDGWLKTGDIAVIDETGQFYIVDRAKELIKSKGHQVAPAELEGLLLKHPNVADCGVIGVDNPEEGTETPRAFVVLQDPSKPLLEVKQWLDKNVARHKKLWGGIVRLDAIPKSPSGKILRRELRDRKNDVVEGTMAKL